MASYRTPKSGSHHLRPPSTTTPSILKKRNSTALNNVPKNKVNFNLVDNLKALLMNFNQNNEKLQYNNLICDIRDAGIEIKVVRTVFYLLLTMGNSVPNYLLIELNIIFFYATKSLRCFNLTNVYDLTF